MGNRTNPKKWDAQQRLAFIEDAAFWRGWVGRADLVQAFGLSPSQISADISAYLELNPGALAYDPRAKRYWGAAEMELHLTTADLSRAIGRFLGPEAKGGAICDRLASIDLPVRTAPAPIVRDLFRAICRQHRLEIHYYSLTSARAQWRWISPHAFAHDGYRWHVRAFCHEDDSYKDFVIGRVAASRSPVAGQPPPVLDVDWNTWEKIRLCPDRGLDSVQRRAVELDYGMHHGQISLTVRRSMKDYTLAYLRLADTSRFPRQLELG
jgi:hypothetical protein